MTRKISCDELSVTPIYHVLQKGIKYGTADTEEPGYEVGLEEVT